jgi:hypothetical protein
MNNLNPPPEPPHPRPLSPDVPQAPTHIWAQLSPTQQREVHQTLAQMCRQLVHQITCPEQPHDHR